jgi:hypothetical protein
MTIDWDYTTECYNKYNKTDFKTPKAMLKVLYDKHGACSKVAEIELLVSPNAVHARMKKDKLELKAKGWRGMSRCETAIRKVDKNLIKDMFCLEIAREIGFSCCYTRIILDKTGLEYKKHWERKKNGTKSTQN